MREEKKEVPEANHPGSCQTDIEEVGKVGYTGGNKERKDKKF